MIWPILRCPGNIYIFSVNVEDHVRLQRNLNVKLKSSYDLLKFVTVKFNIDVKLITTSAFLSLPRYSVIFFSF